MTDIREQLSLIKARLDARGYACANEDEQARRITTIDSQADVVPLLAALEAVLDHADRDDRPDPMPRSYTVATSVMAKSQERAQIKKLIRDALEAHDDDQ